MRILRTYDSFPGWRAVARLGLLAWLGLAASVGWAQTNFGSAQIISGQWGGVTNDNTGVIPDAGGPSHGGFLPQHPLWYKWVAQESGEVTLDTLGSTDTNGLILDTVVAVYIGPDISHLIQVAANDDYYPFTHVVVDTQTYGQPIGNPTEIEYPLPLSGPSILRFNATAGTTYYIAVDSMPGKGLTDVTFNFSWLSQVGQGLISLNWAFRPSGVLRFATEEYDIYGWAFGSSGGQSMPPPLYQCTENETPEDGCIYGTESTFGTCYTYKPPGVLVTVTRLAGSCGRLWVDYTTADITNSIGSILGPFQAPVPAVGGTDYIPVSGTLVFDDFEMSKTIVIPIVPKGYYYSTNNPNDPQTKWPTNQVDHDFQVILSNPRLDPYETTNVSPPRLDSPFATATVRILSMAGLGSDPDQNWTGTPPNTAPSHDVYNFTKRNYRVARDVNNYYTPVMLEVDRTHQRVPGTRSETINFRVNGWLATSIPPVNINNCFTLNPGSDYAIPDPADACYAIFPSQGGQLDIYELRLHHGRRHDHYPQ